MFHGMAQVESGHILPAACHRKPYYYMSNAGNEQATPSQPWVISVQNLDANDVCQT